jgi:hypothetical protein
VIAGTDKERPGCSKIQTEFPTFANEKTASCSLFIAFTGGIKNTMKKLPQIVYRLIANEFLKWLKIYIFEKIIGRKSEGKNINKIKKY